MENLPIIEDENFCSVSCPFFNQKNFSDAICKKDYQAIMYFDGFRSHCIVKTEKPVVPSTQVEVEETAYDRCV